MKPEMMLTSSWPLVLCETLGDGDVDDSIKDLIKHGNLGKESSVFQCVPLKCVQHSSDT